MAFVLLLGWFMASVATGEHAARRYGYPLWPLAIAAFFLTPPLVLLVVTIAGGKRSSQR